MCAQRTAQSPEYTPGSSLVLFIECWRLLEAMKHETQGGRRCRLLHWRTWNVRGLSNNGKENGNNYISSRVYGLGSADLVSS